MKKLLFLLICTIYLHANAQITFQKTIQQNASTHKVFQTNDGGYMLYGASSDANHHPDFLLIKTNAFGDTLWTKAYGGTSTDVLISCIQTSNGGFMLFGSTTSFGATNRAIFIIKTDLQGNLIWSKTIGGDLHSNIGTVKQTTDKGYIITGGTSSCNGLNGDDDVFVLKIDSNANIAWMQTYGMSGTETGISIEQTADGGYVAACTLFETQPTVQVSNLLIRTDNLGDTIWAKTYKTKYINNPLSIASCIKTLDGGFILSFYTNHGDTLAFYTKINSSGNVIWSRKANLNPFKDSCAQQISNPTAALPTNDKGFLLAYNYNHYCNTTGYNTDGNGIIIKTDSVGNTLWQTSVPHTPPSYEYISQTSDSGFIVIADSGLAAELFSIIKLDKNGNSYCKSSYSAPSMDTISIISVDTSLTINWCPWYTTGQSPIVTSGYGTYTTGCSGYTDIKKNISPYYIKIYPNPANNKITIDANDVTDVKLFDVLGKQIFTSKQNQIDVSNFNEGVYFIQVQTNTGTTTQKIVVQH